MSNNTIDPRILTRHDGAQNLSMAVETEGEPDAGSQIGVDKGDQQFLPTPTFDLHGFEFSFEQPLFLESSHSNTSSTNPILANSTTQSLQLPQYTSPGFDGSNIPPGVYFGDFNQQIPQPVNHPSSLNSLSLFSEYDQVWQPQDYVIAPAEQNPQPCPDIQFSSPTLSSFVGGHFNGLSATVPSDFWDLHSSSDVIPEYPNHGANNTSQMITPDIQLPHLLQSESWFPTSTISLDLPFYELSSNTSSRPGNIVCSETDNINNLVRDVASTVSSCRFPEAGSTVSTAPSATVPAWDLPPATESADILHPDQYFLGSHNESNRPLFSRNDTLEAVLQEQRNESDGNGSEAIGVSEIDIAQPDKLNQPTEPARITAAARAFGPSRPVLLPPARRGGRKGALSKEELEKRRESRRTGVCIRCRQMKSKCRGGFPCTACRENSKATLWVRPCVKAHFLDIVECGSYFSAIAALKREAIDRMNEESTDLQFATIVSLNGTRHFSLSVGGFEGLAEFPCAIIWDIVLNMLFGSQGIFSEVETSIANFPEKLTELRSSTSPIILGYPGEPETRDLWLLHRIIFCTRGSVHWVSKDEDLPSYHKERLEIYKKTRETLLWVGQRIEEIKLFRYFQEAANKLNSMSIEELLNFCRGILQVLHLGLADVYLENEEMHHREKSSESQLLTQAIHDRKDRIRRALIVYLAIAVEKLPPWSNFWQEQQNLWLQTSSDVFKRSLESLETFDKEFSKKLESLEEIVCKEFKFLVAVEKDKKGLPWDLTKPSFDVQKLLYQAVRNVRRGHPDLRSQLQRAVEEFEYLVKPILREIENMVKLLDVEVVQSSLGEKSKGQASDIKDYFERIEKDGQAVQQKLRDRLAKKPPFEEIDSEFPSTGELLRRANTIFNTMALNLGVIHDEMVEGIDSIRIIEFLRKADLPILNSADEEFLQYVFTDIKEDFFSYLKVLRRTRSSTEHGALTPEETILQQRLKKKLDNITLLVQKEKFKWLCVHLGHLIITDAARQDVEYPLLVNFVKEFLDFFGNIDGVKVKDY